MNFTTFLKANKNARKIFGRKELDIISKQLDGITLTQSEKNRLSRDIRQKLDFIKEIAQFETQFELKKAAEADRIIEKAVKLILEDELKDKIRAVFLFGSHVHGFVTRRSDIDICVVFDELGFDIDNREATKFRIRILGNLPDKVDIQVFNVLPQKIKRAIAAKHKILYKINNFDNTGFTIRYLKDEDYFIRMNAVFGEV
ncbi:TPA: nucleotidyltransferase domain-containing protein [Candidatus Woesearchaeota archaeon]|nr:nucleotidyltransferase domain-containing protein [Candidatus Woesearchaeota archaeon]